MAHAAVRRAWHAGRPARRLAGGAARALAAGRRPVVAQDGQVGAAGRAIKVAFVGWRGFVQALAAHGWLPQASRWLLGAGHPVAINLQFGPLLVLGHRWLNNRISGTRAGSTSTAACGAWPGSGCPRTPSPSALPPDWRIGLAALWSVVLGLILGMYSPVRQRRSAA